MVLLIFVEKEMKDILFRLVTPYAIHEVPLQYIQNLFIVRWRQRYLKTFRWAIQVHHVLWIKSLVLLSHPVYLKSNTSASMETGAKEMRSLQTSNNTVITLWAKISHQRFYSRDFNYWAAAWQSQQNDMYAQRRFTSAWASGQTGQSLCCAVYG